MDTRDLIQLIHDVGYDVFCYDGCVAVRTRSPASVAIAIADAAYDNDMFEDAITVLRTVREASLGGNSLLYFTDVRWEDDDDESEDES